MNLIHMAAIKHITFNKISSTCIYIIVLLWSIRLRLYCWVWRYLYNSLFCIICCFVLFVVLYYSLFCTTRCFVQLVVFYYSLFCTTRCFVQFVVLYYSLFCTTRCFVLFVVNSRCSTWYSLVFTTWQTHRFGEYIILVHYVFFGR